MKRLKYKKKKREEAHRPLFLLCQLDPTFTLTKARTKRAEPRDRRGSGEARARGPLALAL